MSFLPKRIKKINTKTGFLVGVTLKREIEADVQR